ncbi:hypothetical protein A9Q84_01615 [Halobacteriovorax marinus]|uniref:Lipoprotein n=1 Tax=Halobacteriovorax marinus TaxID=97084 RepID=A0A1Y5FCE0_9BACT|nr:hypothetical protein A9Q84_01615 [Halobacteriovorax marinus]
MKNTSLIITMLFITSCSTIHYRFDNQPDGTGGKQWHHVGVFQTVEFSDDVRVKERCPNGPHEITSRRNGFQAVIALVPWLGWAWSPTEVSIECAELVAMNDSERGANAKANAQSDSKNTNTNTININISPEMLKKKGRKKKE